MTRVLGSSVAVVPRWEQRVIGVLCVGTVVEGDQEALHRVP